MKKTMLTLALLATLLCATSASATVLPVDTSIWYQKGTAVNTWSVAGVSSSGTGPLLLTLSFNTQGIGSSGSSYLKVYGVDPLSPTVYSPVFVTAAQSFYSDIQIPVTESKTGVYAFDIQIKGVVGSAFNLQSASLTGGAKTPIPAAALLLGSGVLGLFGIGKARNRRNS